MRVRAEAYSSAVMKRASAGPHGVEPLRRYVTCSQQAHVVDDTVGSGAWVRKFTHRVMVRVPSASTREPATLAATSAAASYSDMN
jgi:hypothetical protein